MYDDYLLRNQEIIPQINWINDVCIEYFKEFVDVLNKQAKLDLLQKFPRVEKLLNDDFFFHVYTALIVDYPEIEEKFSCPIPVINFRFDFADANPGLTIAELEEVRKIAKETLTRAGKELAKGELLPTIYAEVKKAVPNSETLHQYVYVTLASQVERLSAHLTGGIGATSHMFVDVRINEWIAHLRTSNYCDKIIPFQNGTLYEMRGYTLKSILDSAFMFVRQQLDSSQEGKIYFSFNAHVFELQVQDLEARIIIHSQNYESYLKDREDLIRYIRKDLLQAADGLTPTYWVGDEYSMEVVQLIEGKNFESLEELFGKQL